MTLALLLLACSPEPAPDAEPVPATTSPIDSSDTGAPTTDTSTSAPATADTSTGATTASTGDTGLSVVPVNVAHEISAVVPTVAHVSWQTAGPSTGYVVFEQDGVQRQTPTTQLGTDHEVAVLGMKAGHDVQLQVVSHDAFGGEHPSAPIDLTVADAPLDLQPAILMASDPARQTAPDGYVALNFRNGQSYTVILDMEGDPVWWMAADPDQQVTTVKPGRDGRSLMWNVHNSDDYLLPGGIHRMSLDGREQAYTEARWAHHDYEQLPDGTMAWIAYTLGEGQLDGATVPLAADAIWEGPEGSVKGTRSVYDVLEDYAPAPYQVCEHLELGRYVDGYHEWTHSNSLMYEESEDAYYMMSKTLDALLKIDRSSGTLLWQLGGRDGSFTLEGEGTIFNHSHMSHVWPGGFAVFDNRVHAPPKVSRAVVYDIDEVAQTVTQVWEFVEPEGGFTGRLGDVRKLDSGNYLVAWGGLGRVSEITEDGTIVWEVRVGGGVNTGRARLLPSLYELPAP